MSSLITITSSGTSVEIINTRVEDNWAHKPPNWNIPQIDSAGYVKNFLNMNMLTRQIDVTGFISTDQTTDAPTARDNLSTIVQTGAVVTFTWDGESISGVMTALNVVEIAGDHATARDFSVRFSVLVGDLSGT